MGEVSSLLSGGKNLFYLMFIRGVMVSKIFCVFCERVGCVIKFGFQRNGVQRFRCKVSDKIFNEKFNTPLYRCRLPMGKIDLFTRLCSEGVSLSSIGRVLDLSKKVVWGFYRKVCYHLKKVNDLLLPELKVEALELDEIYIKCQQQVKGYFWVGMDPKTKVYLGSRFGSRDVVSLKSLLNDLKFLRGRLRLILIDGYQGFRDLINKTFGKKNICVGVLIKDKFSKATGSFKTMGLNGVSRDKVEELIQEMGLGKVINTAHIESQNRTIRDRISYFGRRTSKIARDMKNVERSLEFYQTDRNLCRPHHTLTEKAKKPTTPMMEARITKKPFTIEELIKTPLHLMKKKLMT